MMKSNDQSEEIVSKHYEALYRFALNLTQSEADARDLTQQAFYIWAIKGHQLRDPSKVKMWLFTALHRNFLQMRRRETRFPQHELESVSHQLPTISPEFANKLDSTQVLSALKQVDEVYQAAVALFYLQDCPYKEIAAILDVPIGTVKSRIARGLVQLREILLGEQSRGSSVQISNAASIKDTKRGEPERTFVPIILRRSLAFCG